MVSRSDRDDSGSIMQSTDLGGILIETSSYIPRFETFRISGWREMHRLLDRTGWGVGFEMRRSAGLTQE